MDLYVCPALDLIVVRMQRNPLPGVPEGTCRRQAPELIRNFVRR
jgi:hypothetical protein